VIKAEDASGHNASPFLEMDFNEFAPEFGMSETEFGLGYPQFGSGDYDPYPPDHISEFTDDIGECI